MPSRTLWLWLFVSSLGVTAVMGMMAFLLDSVPYQTELLATSGLLSAYSLAGLVASIAIVRGRSARLAGLVMVAAVSLALSFLVWVYLIWFNSHFLDLTEEILARFGGTPAILGVLGLHVALLLLVPFERRVSRVVRWLTIASACGLACMLLCLLWDFDWLPDDWMVRLTGALALPSALGTIAVPVLARIEFVSRRDGEEHSIGRHVEVFIRCPRCGHEGEQTANRRGLCPGCGLETTITLAEPRCLCGYLLHGLPEPVCPECGHEVDQDKWWRPKT
jgi:hypothetical protein